MRNILIYPWQIYNSRLFYCWQKHKVAMNANGSHKMWKLVWNYILFPCTKGWEEIWFWSIFVVENRCESNWSVTFSINEQVLIDSESQSMGCVFKVDLLWCFLFVQARSSKNKWNSWVSKLKHKKSEFYGHRD